MWYIIPLPYTQLRDKRTNTTTCKFNSSCFHVKKEGREREEGGLLGASTYIIKQTHIDILGLYTGHITKCSSFGCVAELTENFS